MTISPVSQNNEDKNAIEFIPLFYTQWLCVVCSLTGLTKKKKKTTSKYRFKIYITFYVID